MAFQSAILLLSLFVPLRLGTPWFIAGCPLFAVSIAGFIAAVHAYAHTPMQETVTRGISAKDRKSVV